MFVSGALVLSGGVVCNKPVSADMLEDLNRLAAKVNCLLEAEQCVSDVLIKGHHDNSDSFCANGHEILECFVQQKKCLNNADQASNEY